MYFLLATKYYTNKKGKKRRLKYRNQHIKVVSELVKSGNIIYGVAILNKKKEWVGSCDICSFTSKKDMKSWIKEDPYTIHKIWKKIKITQVELGKPFESNTRN